MFKWEHFFIKQLIWQNSTKPPRVSELHFLIASWFSFGTVFLCYEISWSSCFKVGGRKHSSNIQDQVQSYLSPLNRLKSSKTKTFLVPFHVEVVPWACHLSVTRVQMFHFRERNYSWWKDSQWSVNPKSDVWDSIFWYGNCFLWIKITLQETNIFLQKWHFEDGFPFPVWWDMWSIPWRVSQFNLYRIIIFKACKAEPLHLN